MRTYSGLLLFENIFDSVPTDSPDMVNLARSITNPNLLIVEADCNTTLGKFEDVNFEAEGFIELSTGLSIDKTRIEYLLSQGIYEVATRHTSTCISKDGICAKCYASTFPTEVYPQINDRVEVLPEYLVNAEIIVTRSGNVDYSMITDPLSYTKTYAYKEGQLLLETVDYTIANQVFSLVVPPTDEKNIVVKCIKLDTFPFVVWLANSFSGSLFGMEPLPSQPLPIRSLLLTSLLTENRLQLVSEYLNQLGSLSEDYLNYVDTIKDPLEKGLYMLALYCIYSNVTS